MMIMLLVMLVLNRDGGIDMVTMMNCVANDGDNSCE